MRSVNFLLILVVSSGGKRVRVIGGRRSVSMMEMDSLRTQTPSSMVMDTTNHLLRLYDFGFFPLSAKLVSS